MMSLWDMSIMLVAVQPMGHGQVAESVRLKLKIKQCVPLGNKSLMQSLQQIMINRRCPVKALEQTSAGTHGPTHIYKLKQILKVNRNEIGKIFNIYKMSTLNSSPKQ